MSTVNGTAAASGTLLRVLVVEDSEDDTFLVLRALDREGYQIESARVETAREMREALDGAPWDLILADYRLPRFSAPQALEVLHETGLDLPFIIVSGSIGEERAAASLRAGAHDFVNKDNLARLAPAVARELREARGRAERKRAERELRETSARLRHLLSATPAVIYTSAAEPPYSCTFISENVEKVLGHPAEAFTASETFWLDQVHPDERPGLERGVPDQVRSRGGVKEYRVLCGDGRYRWIRDEFSVEPAENGEGAQIVGYLIDVTSRRVTEETLAETQEAYQALFERSHDGIAITTLDGRILSGNPAITDFLGVGSGRLKGHSALEFYEDAHQRDRFLAALDEGPVQNFPLRLVSLDGRRIDALVSAVPITWSEGQDRGIISLIRDVTEQKRSEDRLRESEERFRQLAEHIDGVFWMRTPDGGEVLYLSPAYEEVTGRQRDAVYENPAAWLDAVHPDDRPRVETDLAEGDGIHFETEYRVVRPDGAVRWVWDRAFPIRDDAGEVYRIVGVAEDITERKEAEAAVERMERYYRSLIESAADAIFVLDPDGKIRTGGAASADLLGVDAEALPGRVALDFVHSEDRERIGRRLAEIMRTPRGQARESYRIVRDDGEVRHVESVARNLLDDPAVNGVVVNSRDLTDRVELERQLFRSQKLEGLGRLAGGVAHDFNNLLTVIQGQSELLLEDLPASSPLRSEVGEILRASRRASDLTKQLLTFSKRQVLEPRLIDLNRSVREMERLLRRVIGEDVEMTLRLAPEPMVVRADPTGLEQVIMNLAINAREAMPAGGRLTLTTRVFVNGEGGENGDEGDAPRRWCAVEVEDSGVGIEGADVDRIFEPFFTTKEKGTGLGLATVYGIVDQSGGVVDVRSRVGSGTTFTVRIPAVEEGEREGWSAGPEAGSASPRSGLGNPAGRWSVLSVDDDPAVRNLVGRVLERHGHRSLVAESVAQALRKVDEAGAGLDLVITDVTLPDGTGMELAEALERRGSHLPILFISGYTSDVVKETDVSTLETGFLSKPFTPDELVRAAEELLLRPDRTARRTNP